MNDKIQLAAMGAEQPVCLQKRVEQLEALLREASDMMGNQPRGFSGMMRRINEALDGAPTTRPAVASLTRYTLGGMCDSFGQDCGAEMEEDADGEYVLLDDVIAMLAAAPKPGDVDA